MSNISLSRSPYRSYYVPTVSAVRRRRSFAIPAKLNFEIGPLTIIIGLFAIAMVLSMFYLGRFHQTMTKGYDLKRLEMDRQQLLDQYQIKNMNLAEAKSMNNILQSGRIQRMVSASKISYVRGDTALASADLN